MNSAPYDLSIPGWMSEPELRWLHDTAAQMGSVVEIGCYQGRSTFALLQGCKGPVYAVDPWDTLPFAPGLPNTKEQFLRNLQSRIPERFEKDPQICQRTSAEAAVFLPDVEMVFIDGNHEYPFVKQDLELWQPKAKKLLSGHDFGYPDWPGVEKAVRERFGTAFQRPVGAIWAVWV